MKCSLMGRMSAGVAGALLVVVGLVLATSGGGAALAANSNGSTTANVAVASSITLSGLTSSFTLSGPPNTTQSANGAVTMKVTTNNNTGYTVTVQGASATMVGQAAGNTDTIPISNLAVRETGTTAWTALSSSSAATVHSQNGRSVSSGDTISNDYQITIPFVNSDTYSATLNYVAATK